MKYYLLIVGVFCILYYLVLLIYSRRLSSTFAGFWLVTGGAHLILGCAPFSSFGYRVLGCFFAGSWIFFLFVERKIFRGMLKRPAEKLDCIIVLGAQVRGTWITNSLKRRLDAALEYLEKYPDTKIIVSGGQGPGEEISEAAAMADYLSTHGIKRSQILCEDRSTSTRENFRYSKQFIDAEHETTGIVTNDFHICRASMIARMEGYRKLRPIPASTNPVFQLNYLVREFFAILALMLPGQRGRRKRRD